MRVTMLGCGGSGGVPLITGDWGRCDPGNPKNARRRPSILVEHGGTVVLVDTGPDFRNQLLDAGCDRLDAILYTHAHADHVHGIDDVRALNYAMRRPIDAYATAETLEEIAARFDYAFRPIEPGGGFYRPQLAPRPIDGAFTVGELDIVPFRQDHGVCVSTGFRFGRFGYSTDVVRLDDAAFETLAGVEVWIVDCLRLEPHPTHAHLERTLEWIDRLAPKRAILTHMNHSVDYADMASRLPRGVEPGFDGLVIEIDDV